MPPRRQTRAAPLGADDGDLAELLRENAEYRRLNDDLRRQVELLTQRMDVVHMHRHDDDATVTNENPFGSPRIRSPERPNPNNRWEQGFKVEIPQFDDSLKPNDFIDWLSQVEEILDFKDVPAERRVSFTLPFEASNVPGYAVAILLFIITFGNVERTDLKSGYLYRAEFINCIFSYVFGDGDPNQGIEEKRWKMIGLYIPLNGCVVTAEEIAPYLLDPETKKMNDESYMLPVLNRFNGQPKVDENGNILYHFPSLHCTSLPTWTSREYAGRWADRGIKVDKFLEEHQWKFSKLDDKALDFVSGILRYNFVLSF